MANSHEFEVGAGYEVANPPMLAVGDDETHRLSRFFTVLTTDEHGVTVYDGWYGDGLASLHLSHEVLAQLDVTRLPPRGEAVAAELANAIATSAAAAIERRNQVKEHGDSVQSEHASQRFFVQFFSGQVRGLASKGLINPDLAVQMISLSTGLEFAAGA
ncbi:MULTISPECIES: hypothetical protein [Pseudomonas]|uniref:Uncharacterized protein n=4 Tax=Pseudomonas TaxID=286 RepID=A0A3G1HJN2_PSEAI|nr:MULTISPECIES: hypothetical protein [Pseudomonas]AMP35810.1 Hypothetical protein [Pseudomonas aeruginosa]AXQ51147.1 hypothetical protein DZC31_31220 [Stenotrophomonas rhizophila]MCO6692739.1 hypothetical protein [Pseudomonas shirazica]ESW38601.1 hypothetical protein O164_17135 [Pseudomonas taiwanensis SJ9]KIC79809.1 hypothetical protein RR51_24810 [Pseudomonas sp. C5pp]